LGDAAELLEMAVEESDEETIDTVIADLNVFEVKVASLEFRRMFSGEMDANNAFLDIQSGSGGTEAQDWAAMIERMFLRWGERKGFKTELIEESQGDVAGIKSATIKFEGEYAFGWLRTETGVHRLVRKSPSQVVPAPSPALVPALDHSIYPDFLTRVRPQPNVHF
jgi:peptide chain release factor 2